MADKQSPNFPASPKRTLLMHQVFYWALALLCSDAVGKSQLFFMEGKAVRGLSHLKGMGVPFANMIN